MRSGNGSNSDKLDNDEHNALIEGRRNFFMRGNTASFKEMSQRQRAVGNTVSNLTSSRFKLQTYRSKDERDFIKIRNF